MTGEPSVALVRPSTPTQQAQLEPVAATTPSPVSTGGETVTGSSLARSVGATPQMTDEAVRLAIIQRSIASYYGSCPCPYNYDRGGRACGGRSAYSRAGGASTLCYASDVSDQMVAAYRGTVTSAPPASNAARPCAENGSCYGDVSAYTGRPKTVAVQGHYRKDGTYVRSHYRSAPRY